MKQSEDELQLVFDIVVQTIPQFLIPDRRIVKVITQHMKTMLYLRLNTLIQNKKHQRFKSTYFNHAFVTVDVCWK